MAEFYDKYSLFGVSLGTIPTWKPETWNYAAVVLFLIPVLSGVLQLVLTVYMQIVQKKRNPAAPKMGCMNVMLYIMPIFSVWFAFNVPAGVGFYWVCSSFFSLVQSVGLNLYFTPERIEKLCEKENKKMQKKYAAGKRTFMQRMLEQQGTAGQQMHERYEEETKDMSRAERTKYDKKVLDDARRRMAEKYGESYDDTGNSDSGSET